LPAGHGVHDAQPHRVQEQVKRVHHATISHPDTLCKAISHMIPFAKLRK